MTKIYNPEREWIWIFVFIGNESGSPVSFKDLF